MSALPAVADATWRALAPVTPRWRWIVGAVGVTLAGAFGFGALSDHGAFAPRWSASVVASDSGGAVADYVLVVQLQVRGGALGSWELRSLTASLPGFVGAPAQRGVMGPQGAMVTGGFAPMSISSGNLQVLLPMRIEDCSLAMSSVGRSGDVDGRAVIAVRPAEAVVRLGARRLVGVVTTTHRVRAIGADLAVARHCP